MDELQLAVDWLWFGCIFSMIALGWCLLPMCFVPSPAKFMS